MYVRRVVQPPPPPPTIRQTFQARSKSEDDGYGSEVVSIEVVGIVKFRCCKRGS